MKISESIENKINKCVVRILADSININWNIPFQIEEPSKGQGTGFFIDKKGHILTCAHVVSGSNRIYIEIPYLNNNKYECNIVSICPEFDLALLKCIEYKSEEYLDLGDSDKLKTRSEVVVIGYPVSLRTSSNNVNNLKYTIGIVNGQQSSFIQTDSAINPGNSGGPLMFNNKVIGINSQKLIGNHVDNVGFAVPINNYKIIKNEIDKKIIYRPDLLIEYDNTDKNIVKLLTNNKTDTGIIISKIYDLSPLKNTKIKEGCILTHINNYEINNNGLTSKYKWIGTNVKINVLLNKFKNDETIKITYYDNSIVKHINIRLNPYIPIIRKIYPSLEDIDYFVLGGMIFTNLNYNYIDNLYSHNPSLNIPLMYLLQNNKELSEDKLIISFVFYNSTVNKLNNIKKNDIIQKVNNINISSLDDFKKALNKPIIIDKNKYIKITNNKNKSVLLSVEKIIEQDLIFSEIYKYELSDFHKKYMK